MKHVALLPVNLGLASSTLTTEKTWRFYLWLGELIEGEPCQFAKNETRIALALDNLAIENNSSMILDKFLEHLENRLDSADLIIADFATSQNGLLRGGILIHLANAIQIILNKSTSRPRFVVILPDLPPPEDLFRIMLDRFISRRRVVLIGANGEAVGQTRSFNPSRYLAHVSRLGDDPATRLKTKLIRRLGHFKIRDDGAHRVCRRYCYDATYCIQELAELYGKHIDQVYGKGRCPAILCEQPVSGWLRDSLLVLATQRNVALFNTKEFLSSSQYSDGDPPLLVVPALYSGQSLAKLLKEFTDHDASIQMNVLAVLSERGGKDRVVELEAGNRKWMISYLVKVNQQEYLRTNCKMCELRLPETLPTHGDRTAMLTTYDMWSMVREAGWKDEEDVPRYRKSLGKVPKLPELVEQHGTWLASKFRLVIQMTGNLLPSDLVIVCPDEKGSRVFTEFLHAVFGMTVIRVPRDVLNLFQTGKSKLRKLEVYTRSNPDWHIRISTTLSGHLVLMDEFNASGGTRRRLTEFARHFGRDIYCYFSIVDLSPDTSKTSDLPTYALYDCQIVNKSTVNGGVKKG